MGIPEEITRVEQEYDELLEEYAGVVAKLKNLRFRHAQIKKQIANLEGAIEDEGKRRKRNR